MVRKKVEKVIHLITESFENTAIEVLQGLEPGPIYIQSAETADGLGIYLCDQPFSLEEAEAQHDFEDPLDAESEIEEIPLDTVEELE